MKNSRSTTLLTSLLVVTTLATLASAQTIKVAGNPVQPGVPFNVAFTNNTTTQIPFSASPLLHLLQPTGELITPEIVGCLPVGMAIPPNGTATLSFTAPAKGPGSAGSFVLLFPYGSGAVARIDVGKASTNFPDIHTYPVNTPYNAVGHEVTFPPNQATADWEFSNTGSSSFKFTSGTLQLFTPGGTVQVASLNLNGISVPAGGATRIQLPLKGLTPGPYTVQVLWIDPGTKAPMIVRHGIQPPSTTNADLHFPGGRVVSWRSSISARVAMSGFPASGSPLNPTWPNLAYILLLGYLPGSSPLPGGDVLPLVADPLLLASLQHGAWGVLGNHFGLATTLSAYCAHSTLSMPVGSGMQINHPNIPAVVGLTVRVAVGAVDLKTPNAFAASQPEEITFR
jgi:hypothetical protein